ncbi:unnamed protein product [Linum tenue]|uniref:Uncharacterized protein n=1 Tax=Linum tenue TaxID=586396 RepID=A0AAV0P3Q7_9ROSI|nr:unnamed protein product [Linum tenue]
MCGRVLVAISRPSGRSKGGNDLILIFYLCMLSLYCSHELQLGWLFHLGIEIDM